MIVAFTPVAHFLFVSGMTILSTKVCVGGDKKEKEATLKKTSFGFMTKNSQGTLFTKFTKKASIA